MKGAQKKKSRITTSSYGAQVLLLCLMSLYMCRHILNRNRSRTENFNPPPPLKTVLGKNYKFNNRVEINFHKPLVYMVSLIRTKELVPKKLLNEQDTKSPVLFVYTQGLERKTKDPAEIYKMNVTSCLVGRQEFPVFFHSTGVYSCHVPKRVPKNAIITLIVSSSLYEIRPYPLLQKFLRESLKNNRLADGRYKIPSTAKWNDQMDDPREKIDSKYEICAMTQERLFPELLDSWISYHRRLGIDQIYIYDNKCKVNLSKKYANRDDIEVLYWPWEKSQIQAQNHFLVHARTRCHWVVLFDVDEYVALRNSGGWKNSMNPKSGNLRLYLRYLKLHGISQLIMKPVDMGSSGIIKQSDHPPPELYVHKMPPKIQTAPKTIAYAAHALPDSRVHTINTFEGYKFHISHLAPQTSPTLPSVGVVHYKRRSWEEYFRKAKGPRNSIKVDGWKVDTWKLEHVPDEFLKTDEKLRFSKFRDMWRQVMKLEISKPVILPKDEVEYENFIKQDGLGSFPGVLKAPRVDFS